MSILEEVHCKNKTAFYFNLILVFKWNKKIDFYFILIYFLNKIKIKGKWPFILI